ncbi:MAG TPA: hypothetical protein VF875_10805, partial [Anaeromyxobacter sp.]
MAAGRRGAWGRIAALALAVALACGLAPPENAAPSSPSTNPPAATLPPAGYALAWSDDFDGNALDGSRWTAETGPRRGYLMTP